MAQSKLKEVIVSDLLKGMDRLNQEKADIKRIVMFLDRFLYCIANEQAELQKKRDFEVFSFSDSHGNKMRFFSVLTKEVGPSIGHRLDCLYDGGHMRAILIDKGEAPHAEHLAAEVVGICHGFLQPLLDKVLELTDACDKSLTPFVDAAKRATRSA